MALRTHQTPVDRAIRAAIDGRRAGFDARSGAQKYRRLLSAPAVTQRLLALRLLAPCALVLRLLALCTLAAAPLLAPGVARAERPALAAVQTPPAIAPDTAAGGAPQAVPHGPPHGAPHGAKDVAADAARVASVTAPATDFTTPEAYEARPGGAATAAPGVFGGPPPNLPPAQAMAFRLGEALFEKLWVPAPTATRASDGLGPLFNARACANCHPAAARGRPPETPPETLPETPGEISGMVLKLALPGVQADLPPALRALRGWHASRPDPALGLQVQDRAQPGVPAEGALDLDWHQSVVTLRGGQQVTLRRPVPRRPAGAAPQAQLSLRVAPQLIGLGLLEAIPEADIRAGADPEDADGDGISGRMAQVWSPGAGRVMAGRFGHKAGAASLRDMAAAAFATDMGLSTPPLPDPWGDCTAAQTLCRAAPTGEEAGLRDGREVSAEALDHVALYTAHLAVPARRGVDDAQALRGKAAFAQAGCPACHRPKFVTARRPDDPARNFQLIWPFTDLLLHDMGPGLADARPEGLASGAEWRTAPLWGIGLTAAVTGRPATYLHDGRARTLLEAVLWHGGEAQPARDRVADMAPATRAALIAYLESL